MTVIIRTRQRASPDFALLSALMLIQAAAFVWMGYRLNALLAATILIGGVATCVAIPAVTGQAFARIRALAQEIQWWHWLWALLWFSDFVFRERSAQSIQDDPLDFWALYRVALVGTAGLVLMWRLATGRGEWLPSMLSGLVVVMAAFPLAGLFSTAWSIYPAWTAYKSVELLVDIAVLGAVIAAAGEPGSFKSLFDWTWVLFGMVQCSVWIGALVAPSRALLTGVGVLGIQLVGVIPDISANGVGHIAAILSVVALSRLLRAGAARSGVLFYSLVFASSFATLILAQTRSALTGFAAGAVLVLLLSRRSAIILAVIIAAAIVLMATSFDSVFLTYFRRGQDAELFDSLSGRTKWWSFAWDRFLERPFTGFGAFAGGRFAALAEMGDQDTSSLHNTYLEAILGLGILGIVPLVICLLGTWWRFVKLLLSRAADGLVRNLGVEMAGVFMVITVRSFFTTDFIWHPALAWLLALGFSESLYRTRRRIPQ